MPSAGLYLASLRITQTQQLLSCGHFAHSREWSDLFATINAAVERIEHPAGSGAFTIYPESGKKSGKGNGVTPIKLGLMNSLRTLGWTIEGSAKNALGQRLGEYDAVQRTDAGPVVLEWETGNVSSSHRSLNKMTMLLSEGTIAAGVLVLPTRRLARFLTDRIGNFEELAPYWGFWGRYPCDNGVLEIIGVEQDAESDTVPRIPKGTDGRALV
jgi:hypothetical protein